jgi:hypothetical protein
MTTLPPRVALVELLQSIDAGASVEVQSQSLARMAPLDDDAAMELFCTLVDLVELAHTAGTRGLSYPAFLDAMAELEAWMS